MIELLKISEIIFYEKLILAGIIAGIFIICGINLSLFLIWLGSMGPGVPGNKGNRGDIGNEGRPYEKN